MLLPLRVRTNAGANQPRTRVEGCFQRVPVAVVLGSESGFSLGKGGKEGWKESGRNEKSLAAQANKIHCIPNFASGAFCLDRD
ncbi:hypothetical protein C0Q70_12889 [Pomacea canaliculata]|uniref:Uncharacterized protein n=1 Tax=Pomacea canaliculata TaxID=400727 RepID=A0A2T7P2T4_POMCA|nr:hypothetical protein C0Q70_12889 [Pomacea canaliculata]